MNNMNAQGDGGGGFNPGDHGHGHGQVPGQHGQGPHINAIIAEVNAQMDVQESDSDADSHDDNDTDSESSSTDQDVNQSKWARRIAHLRYSIGVHKERFQPKSIYLFRPYTLTRRNFKIRNALFAFPTARSGHRITADESTLYCLGGYNPRSALINARRGQCLLFQELWAYNFATNRWDMKLNLEKAPNMPRELASNALEMYNNVLITHGGTGYPFGEVCSNDCVIYTTGPKPIVFSLKASGEKPTPQYGPGIIIHDDYLYTIGGTTGFEYSCDVYRLDLRTNNWQLLYVCRPEIREDPEGRYRHEVVCDGKHIYVLGGGTSQSVYDLQRIPAFNMKKRTWEFFQTLADRSVPQSSTADHNAGFPRPRKCFSCVSHTTDNGDVEAFITGGLQGDYTHYFDDVWRLNLRTKQWTLIRTAHLPRPLYFHSAAHAGNGCMYIFGGIEYTDKEMRRRNDLYKMWIKIPKLSEICWEAITYYNENLDSYHPKTLRNCGIPQRFIDRLPFSKDCDRMYDTEPMDIESAAKRLRAFHDN